MLIIRADHGRLRDYRAIGHPSTRSELIVLAGPGRSARTDLVRKVASTLNCFGGASGG
jgi:hypothetical protein